MPFYTPNTLPNYPPGVYGDIARGGDRGMAQGGLHQVDRATLVKGMTGMGMAQPMGRNRNPSRFGPAKKAQPLPKWVAPVALRWCRSGDLLKCRDFTEFFRYRRPTYVSLEPLRYLFEEFGRPGILD